MASRKRMAELAVRERKAKARMVSLLLSLIAEVESGQIEAYEILHGRQAVNIDGERRRVRREEWDALADDLVRRRLMRAVGEFTYNRSTGLLPFRGRTRRRDKKIQRQNK